MASFEILLIRVRSDTPTSFFLVLSNTAFFEKAAFWAPPPAAAASFLRPARLLTAYMPQVSIARLFVKHRGGHTTIVDAQPRVQR